MSPAMTVQQRSWHWGLWTEKKAPPDEESTEAVASFEFDPSQICDLAQMAEKVALVQETSQHWPWIASVQQSLDWIHTSTGCPWSDPSIV